MHERPPSTWTGTARAWHATGDEVALGRAGCARERSGERSGEARSLEQARHAVKTREGKHRLTVGALADKGRPHVVVLVRHFRVQAVAATVGHSAHLQLLRRNGLANRGIQPHVVSSVGLLPAAELSNPWQSGAIRTAIDGGSGFELASEVCDCRLSYSLRLGQSCVADESGGLQVVALETAIDTGNAKVWEVDGAEVHVTV